MISYKTIKVTDVKHFMSCIDGQEVTTIAFLDGKTLRVKQFRYFRDIKAGQTIQATKLGKGKYAGYNF